MNELEEIANEVYNTLGAGHNKYIYQRAIEIELMLRNVPYSEKITLHIFYKDFIVSWVDVDLVLGNVVVVIKTEESIQEEDVNQLERYMSLFSSHDIKGGLIINFPSKKSDECEFMYVENTQN